MREGIIIFEESGVWGFGDIGVVCQFTEPTIHEKQNGPINVEVENNNIE